MIPSEQTINRLMDDTGLARMQAIRHLQGREHVRRVVNTAKQEGRRHDK